jgi:hypothetical protein
LTLHRDEKSANLYKSEAELGKSGKLGNSSCHGNVKRLAVAVVYVFLGSCRNCAEIVKSECFCGRINVSYALCGCIKRGDIKIGAEYREWESREACAAAVTVGFSLMMLMDTLFG